MDSSPHCDRRLLATTVSSYRIRSSFQCRCPDFASTAGFPQFYSIVPGFVMHERPWA